MHRGAGGLRQIALGAAIVMFGAMQSAAQDADPAEDLMPLPSFADCMNEEAARYERALRAAQGMSTPQKFEIGDTRGTGYCGSVGFVLCDRKGDLARVQNCQSLFALEQDVLASKVRAGLPVPDALGETGTDVERELYQRLYALAHGSSAGPDCAGDIPQRRTWCTAWEANNRLSNAILAWQLARFLGAAEPAVVAGWAETPPPQRPQARATD
ncbi:hypothetical protein [Sagittula sp. SSi028]|uniref:hypothetical protein n=1 Tax=Sagittula sp. SSi028 TaxID=3400636 RepID=UPI003AF4F2BF